MSPSPEAGHGGREKTFNRVSNLYYWPGMYKDVSQFVQKCKSCQEHKVEQRLTAGTMGLKQVGGPWEIVTTDILGPFSVFKGKLLCCIFQDSFSKWLEYGVLRNATAHAIGEVFKNTVIYRHGVPLVLLSDNGTQYDSNIFKVLAKSYGFTHEFTPRYSPQCNPIERTNRTLKTMIRQFCDEKQRKWDVLLPELVFAWNTAQHVSTGFSPAILNFGRELVPPNSLKWDKVDRLRDPRKVSVSKQVENVSVRVRNLVKLVKENLEKAAKNKRLITIEGGGMSRSMSGIQYTGVILSYPPRHNITLRL